MRYLKPYRLYESLHTRPVEERFFTKLKHWDYEIGYLWSEKLREISYVRDMSVMNIATTRTGTTYGLIGYGFRKQIREHLGKWGDEVCMFHPHHEFIKRKYFELDKFETHRTKYVLMDDPSENNGVIGSDGKMQPDMLTIEIKEGDTRTWREIFKDVTYREHNDEDEEIGLWTYNVRYYDANGLKFLSIDSYGSQTIMLKKDDVEKVIDTIIDHPVNYFRYEDKSKQILKLNSIDIEFTDIKNIFIDFEDCGFRLSDFNQVAKDRIMVLFRGNMNQVVNFKDELSEAISRFEDTYNCKFDNITMSNRSLYADKDSWMSNKTYDFKLHELVGKLDVYDRNNRHIYIHFKIG